MNDGVDVTVLIDMIDKTVVIANRIGVRGICVVGGVLLVMFVAVVVALLLICAVALCC